MSGHSTDFMARALELARLGRGSVEPNPLVGCVIEKAGRIIGEGYHRYFGGPHAEPDALGNCAESPEGATAYVSLEPCCHTRKKTPPCVPLLLAAKIARVVVGCADPNPPVCGQGIRQLREAGVDVQVGVLEEHCRQINAPFFCLVAHGRPYVTLKWAQTADGKVAGSGGQRMQIGNENSTRLVHALRGKSDAVLVGINTVLADDPLLTARGVPSPRPLVRIVLDTHLRIPLDCHLVNTIRTAALLVCCSPQRASSPYAAALRKLGAEIMAVPLGDDGRLSLPRLLAELARQKITHLLVEPGPTLAQSFLDSGLVDRVWLFKSPMMLNIPDAPAAPPVGFPSAATCQLGADQLVEMLNPGSPVFASLDPSPDVPGQ